MRYGYIYLITNKANSKTYVGQHKGNFDEKYWGSGKLIQREISKETRKKISESLKNYFVSEETREGQRMAALKRYALYKENL